MDRTGLDWTGTRLDQMDHSRVVPPSDSAAAVEETLRQQTRCGQAGERRCKEQAAACSLWDCFITIYGTAEALGPRAKREGRTSHYHRASHCALLL